MGVALALGTSRLLSALLFEVRPSDVVTLVGVVASMLVVAVFASIVPVRSSMRISPMIALRDEGS
jgi:putative ABC transport system permease protein